MCLHISAARKPQSTHVTFEAFLSQYESTSSNGYFGKHINHTVTHVTFEGFLSVVVSGPTPNKALFKELVAPPWRF